MKNNLNFDDKYTGDIQYNYDNQEGQDGIMETFSPHIEIVLELANSKDPKNYKRVWTIIESDSEDLIIIAGYHLVDRVMYFISNEMWESNEESYSWS